MINKVARHHKYGARIRRVIPVCTMPTGEKTGTGVQKPRPQEDFLRICWPANGIFIGKEFLFSPFFPIFAF